MKRLRPVIAILVLVYALGLWQRAALLPYVAGHAPALGRLISALPGYSSAVVQKDAAGGGSARSALPVVPVTFTEVRQADFPIYLSGLGTVQPFNTVTVRSRVDGQITSVLFKQGQMVKEGDPLVEIDKRPYQGTLDSALARKAQDEASLKDAKLNLERYNSLARQDFASRQQLDTQQALVEQLTAQVQGDQGAINNARTQLSYTTITAPLSGKTGFRLIDAGNIVHASDQNGIVTIVQMQPISVVFSAPEDQVQEINAALNKGAVPVNALSSDGTKVLSHGRLVLVDNAVNQATGTIALKAVFANDDNNLWPGLSVTTQMRIDLLKNVTVVPESVVQHGPYGLFAYVIGEDNKVSVREIGVRVSGNGRAVVSSGLKTGEKVVVTGQYRLLPGSPVEATPAKPLQDDAMLDDVKLPAVEAN